MSLDEYDDSDFVYTPETESGKEGIVFFGQKGAGKTSAAYLLDGPKVVLSFDGKSLRVKELMRPDDKDITVLDASKYISHWKNKMTEAGKKTVEYSKWLLDETAKRGGCDWVIIDGLEMLIEAAEMAMRYDHKIGPFDGFATLGFWKDRKANIRAIHDSAFACATKGVVWCYDKHTRAVTTTGLKMMDELRPGDLVYSLNRKGEIEVKPVTSVQTFPDYEGPMVKFEGKKTDLFVTPGHRMLLQGCHHGGKWNPDRVRIVKAKELVGRGREIRFPVGKWVGGMMNRMLPCAPENFFYAIGLYIGDGCMNENRRTSYKGKSYGPYKWAQLCIPEGDRAREDAVMALNHNAGLKLSLYKNTIEFHPRDFAPFFAECGKSAKEKRIPSWMLDASAPLLQKLWNGLMDSDGHKQTPIAGHLGRKSYSYRTVSEKLAQDVAVLAVKLGMCPSISECAPAESEYNGVKIHSGKSYVVYASLLFGMSNKATEVKNYKGTVWCPCVADNENLLVERNGKFAFCGNTTYVDKDEIVNNATLVKKTDIPKWMDIVMYFTDAVVKCQIDTIGGKEHFRLYVISSKIKRFKTGTVLDVTDKLSLTGVEPIGAVPEESKVNLEKAIKRKKAKQKITICQDCGSPEIITEMGVLHCTKCDWVHEDEGD